VAAALAGLATPARAWVQTTTDEGRPMHWRHTDITVLLYTGDPPAELDRATLVGAAHAAAAVWSAPTLMCTDIQLTVTETDEAVANVAYDGTNRITFRRDMWRKMPCNPAVEDCTPYDRDALAITSVFAQKRDGLIVDADMEINAVNTNFKWSDVVRDGGRGRQDIQNVLTHEFGHLIGLDHTCFLPTGKPRPRDNTGAFIPDCSAASPDVQETTMFASAIPGDTRKRDLAPDDMAGACTIYPVGSGSEEEDDGGCAVAGGGPGGGAGMLPLGAVGLAAAVGLALRARRRGR
jgi:MYXO-CTERM domain-containing protein